jgi:hypothetical protein
MRTDLIKNFTYQELTKEQQEKTNLVRLKFIEIANFLDETLPVSREKSLALTHLEESCFYSNAAISRYL